MEEVTPIHNSTLPQILAFLVWTGEGGTHGQTCQEKCYIMTSFQPLGSGDLVKCKTYLLVYYIDWHFSKPNGLHLD